MLAARLLRARIAAATSVATSLPAKIHGFGKFDCFHTRLKSEGLKYLGRHRLQKVSFETFVFRRCFRNAQSLWNSGRKVTTGSVLVCAGIGSFLSLRTQNACADDFAGSCISDDLSQTDLKVGPCGTKRRYSRTILLMHKLKAPLFLIFTLWTKWGQTHPLFLMARILLIFACTKPVTSSIYIFLDRLQYQMMSQQPLWYRYQTLDASKVEVKDYTFLCLAKVHIKKETLVLAGFLGGWWILPFPSWGPGFLFDKLWWKKTFSGLGSRFRLSASSSWY